MPIIDAIWFELPIAVTVNELIVDAFSSADALHIMGPDLNLFVAVKFEAPKVRVSFSQDVEETAELMTPGRYTITGPTSLTVSAVEYATDHVLLTLAGTPQHLGVYTLTIPAYTAKVPGSLGVYNEETIDTFIYIDTSIPTVTNFVPAVGTPINLSTDALQFDVTDNTSMRKVFIWATFSGLVYPELIWDGAVFMPRYIARSTVTDIAGGQRFRLLRDGNWPSAPTIKARLIDVAGNEG